MALTELAKGAITTDGTEQTIRDETVTGLKNYATTINCKNMVAGDIIELRVYIYDPQAATITETYRTFSISNAQTDDIYFIPFMPTARYKVTIKRTAGTDRAYDWVIHYA